MNILIVTQYFWPENFQINDLAKGLLGKGHEVTVLTGMPNYPDGRFFPGYGITRIGKRLEDHDGVSIIRVPLLPRGRGGTWNLSANYMSYAFFASLMAPFRCNGKYDVIFVYEPSPITVGLPALVLKKIKRVPIAFWVQDLWPESLSATGAVNSRFLLKLVEKLVRFIYRGCDLILIQSRMFFAPVERLGVGADRIRYFPNSAEGFYEPLSADPDSPEGSELPNGFRVLFAGNIGAAQDFETILSAAKLLKGQPDIRLVIIGDGRMYEWVEKEVCERGLTGTVHLLGRRPPEAMPRYFALADALLVTLRKDPIFSLTIPSKLQTYLACGRPIIAALDGEGARVVEEAGAGIPLCAEDPNALANAILQMYGKSESERREMGLRGRNYFETHFEREMLLDRLNGWMKDLAGGVRG